MKLRKNLGRLATAFVATAMLASLAAVPASADDNVGIIGDETSENEGYYNDENNTPLTGFTFTKELVRPATGDTPDVSFKFTMTGVDADETISDGNNTAVTGNAEGKTLETKVTFGDDNADEEVSEPANGLVTVTDDVTFSFSNLSFDQPGIYKFNLTEEQVGGLTSAYKLGISDTNKYCVYLYVERVEGQDDPVVTGVELVNGSDHTGSKTNKVTNYYMSSPSGADHNALTVTKKVDGNMGDLSENEKFSFTVTIIPGDNKGRTYSVSGTTKTAGYEGNNYKVTAELSHNGTFTINGLMPGDKYTIDEDDTVNSSKGYKIKSITATGVKVEGKDAQTLNDAQQVTFDKEADDSVIYTNNRDAVSPTGLVMNMAPYALLVVVAAGACFVFLRKRRED